ncbi:MAG: acyl-CoA synthetase FdrA [Pseudomonadota bacterium]
MSGPVVLNRVRRRTYLDSVALMRRSRELAERPGVEGAAMMIGTEGNKRILDEAGLLTADGLRAGANDLIIAVSARSRAAGEAALATADAALDRPSPERGEGAAWRPKSLAAAAALEGANLALISVPGEFAAEEAAKALRRGLHVMLFSDNVAVAEERRLKDMARQRGLLLMGPDCGTALIGGVGLAFANAVNRGPIGIVSASGTGLQEVSCLISRAGQGISHAIGVGGRDLSDAVGGLMTLSAIDALDADPETGRLVLVSKPPGADVARRILDRVARSPKPFTICFLGLAAMKVPANAKLVATLEAAAADALGRALPGAAAPDPARRRPRGRWVKGLFAGGTLCAEAQVVLRMAGETVYSNAPVPGARALKGFGAEGHVLADLGAEDYTRARPHPMIDPSLRTALLKEVLSQPEIAVVLIDVVIGKGAHDDPAKAVAEALAGWPEGGPAVVASVCGTDGDRQGYSDQVRKLAAAGAIVAPSNAAAARLALALLRPRG